MNLYEWISVLVAVAMYFPLGYLILKEGKEQNLATWVLWAVLDTLVAGSTYVQGGNWYLVTTYIFGSTCITICILKSGTFQWTPFVFGVCGLAGLCMYGWIISGPRLATILSTAAVVVSSIPQGIDTWKKPHHCPILVYVGFTISSVFSLVGAKAWSIEERLYPVACIGLTTIFILTACRQFVKKPLN